MSNGSLPDTDFWRQFRGRFFGVLKWTDLESLWETLKASPADWHVFDPAGEAPTKPLPRVEFLRFLDEAEAMINQRSDRPSSGSVYLDDLAAPTYIKIFDPLKMGTSCSHSSEPIMPRWILSHMVPDTLPLPPPVKNPTIFQRLIGRAGLH